MPVYEDLDDKRIKELVEHLINSMDIEAMENFIRGELIEYYSSDGGRDDLETNYAEMKEMMGDDDNLSIAEMIEDGTQ